MRMSEIASKAVYDKLVSMSAVTNVVGTRILNRAYLSPDYEYPALIHYAEPGGGGYASAVNSAALPETVGLRYVVRLVCIGESTDPVDDAADAILTAFNGNLPALAGYAVEVEPLEPWPQMLGVGTLVEGGEPYSETGDFYSIRVLRYG